VSTRVQLRDVREEDLEHFFQQQAEPAATAMAVVTPRDRDAFFKHWRTCVLVEATTFTVVFEDTAVGYVTSFTAEGKRNVGYLFARAFWGRGIATEALAAFLLLEKHRPLTAEVAATNTASARVLEKNGFSFVQQQICERDGVEEAVYRID
jgi:RimJ/RimL family protein N-acetyltransferase